MQEQILLQNFSTGTTITFFDTQINTNAITLYPSALYLNSTGVPYKLVTFDGKELWVLQHGDNTYKYVSLTANTNIITGNSFYSSVNYVMTANEISQITTDFYSQMNTLSSGTSRSFISFSNPLIDDCYVNIKLQRTIDTLNTLSIENTVINSIPDQESSTGVVFGKLEAIQIITDAEGENKIKIPLRNVPICLFNPSTDFPSSTSTDSDGNRLTLNLKETSTIDNYFNVNSFTADTAYFLKSYSGITEIPDQYKYTTTTNENGEFIIFDVPTTNQVAMFEVDLLKQGLTEDEVALNYFPYPSTTNYANVDSVPHFFFRQIPVYVFPSWGNDIQSGYTELNISVNLDLKVLVWCYLSITCNGR